VTTSSGQSWGGLARYKVAGRGKATQRPVERHVSDLSVNEKFTSQKGQNAIPGKTREELSFGELGTSSGRKDGTLFCVR